MLPIGGFLGNVPAPTLATLRADISRGCVRGFVLPVSPPGPDPRVRWIESHCTRQPQPPHRRPVPLPPGHGATGGTLLVDGVWQADWKIVKGALEIEPFIPLSAADRDAVAAEGERLLGFATPAIAVRDVRFAPVRSG